MTPNTDTAKTPKDLHEKRFSERSSLRISAVAVILLAHLYLYAAAGRYLWAPFEALWVLAGTLSLVILCVTRAARMRCSAARTVRFRRATEKFGVLWSMMILLTAAMMLVLSFAEPILAGISVELMKAFPSSQLFLFKMSLIISSLFCAYGIFEARTIRTVYITVNTEKDIGEEIRLVQLTDLHVNPGLDPSHLERTVNAALAAEPDIIVITGDIIDGEAGDEGGIFESYAPYAEKLAELALYAPRLGVWAVPGNHDYFDGLENTAAFLQTAGIKLLRTEKVDLGDMVLLGADDPDHLNISNSDPSLSVSEALVASLSDDEEKKFVLLLRHRPVVEPSTIGHFDLQLSGHTHGGQLFTLPSSRHRIPGHTRGTVSLGSGSELYVSNGAGFVGPPMRFLAPAEVAVIDIKKQ